MTTSRSKKKVEEPSNEFTAQVSVRPPLEGTQARKNLLQWLNLQHAGVTHAPETITKEHEDSHWDLAKSYQMTVHLRLKKDGRSEVTKIDHLDTVYDVVPQKPRPTWSVKVKKCGSTYRTVLTIGNQGFELARDVAEEGDPNGHKYARQHCNFLKRMFLVAMDRLGVQPTEKPAKARSPRSRS